MFDSEGLWTPFRRFKDRGIEKAIVIKKPKLPKGSRKANYAEFLNIKEGDELCATIKQVNVDGKQVQPSISISQPS